MVLSGSESCAELETSYIIKLTYITKQIKKELNYTGIFPT
jgi:hypothetical protein